MNPQDVKKNNSTDSDEISLKELIVKMREWWSYLLSRWFIIAVVGVIGGFVGFAYAYFNKPVYTATTIFVLEDEKGGGGLGSLAGLASMAGIDIGGGGGLFQGDNILNLYKSRSILQQTLLTQIDVKDKKQLLIDRYIEFNQLKKKWVDKPELMNLKFVDDSLQDGGRKLRTNRLRDSILGIIVADLNENYLTVSKPDKKISTIKVDVKAEDEIFAKNFNDELVKIVNEFYINTKTKKTLQNVRILQHKTDSVRKVMNGAIYSAAIIADATPNLNPTRQVQRAAPVQKAQFSAETNKAILGEMVKNLEMSKMSLMRETPLIQVVDEPIYPLEEDKVGKVKGIVLGGVIFGFIAILLIVIKRLFNLIINS